MSSPARSYRCGAPETPWYEETIKLGKRAFDDDDAGVPVDVPEDLITAILHARQAS